jgi:RNA polymerase sigma-70 factor (ECF subfamily)
MDSVELEAIRRVRDGDRDAFRILMDRHLAAVLRVTERITGNAVDAEEATQEAFLAAYHRISKFRAEASFGTWVYRIAVNRALNLVERRGREVTWSAKAVEPTDETAYPASALPTPEAELLRGEAIARRERAMQCLTPMERTALVLRHLEDQSMREVAEALNISVNAAKQAVFRAVAKMRRELSPPAMKTQPTNRNFLEEAR